MCTEACGPQRCVRSTLKLRTRRQQGTGSRWSGMCACVTCFSDRDPRSLTHLLPQLSPLCSASPPPPLPHRDPVTGARSFFHVDSTSFRSEDWLLEHYRQRGRGQRPVANDCKLPFLTGPLQPNLRPEVNHRVNEYLKDVVIRRAGEVRLQHIPSVCVCVCVCVCAYRYITYVCPCSPKPSTLNPKHSFRAVCMHACMHACVPCRHTYMRACVRVRACVRACMRT